MLLTTDTSVEPILDDDLTIQNYRFGVKGTRLGLEGKVSVCVHLMYIWREVTTYGGGMDRPRINEGVDRIVGIINKTSITRDKIKADQRIGGRLVQLKKAFGWAILLFEDISVRVLRDIHTETFEELMGSVKDEAPIFSQTKKMIDRRLSPEYAKQLIIQIVSNVSGDSVFTRTVIDYIDQL